MWLIIPELSLLLLLIWSSGFPFQNHLKHLDLSCEMDQDVWGLFWKRNGFIKRLIYIFTVIFGGESYNPELQIRGGIENNSELTLLFLNETVCCDCS